MPSISESSESKCIWEFLKCCCGFTLCVHYSSLSPLHTGIHYILAEFLSPLRFPKVTTNTIVSLEVQSVNYLELTPIQLKEMLPVNVLGTEFRNILFKVQAH